MLDRILDRLEEWIIVTLIGAATVAGAFWGGLAALGAPLEALIISHSFWDVFIFLIAPTVKKER